MIRVLVACERSGIVRAAFNAYSGDKPTPRLRRNGKAPTCANVWHKPTGRCADPLAI